MYIFYHVHHTSYVYVSPESLEKINKEKTTM